MVTILGFVPSDGVHGGSWIGLRVGDLLALESLAIRPIGEQFVCGIRRVEADPEGPWLILILRSFRGILRKTGEFGRRRWNLIDAP